MSNQIATYLANPGEEYRPNIAPTRTSFQAGYSSYNSYQNPRSEQCLHFTHVRAAPGFVSSTLARLSYVIPANLRASPEKLCFRNFNIFKLSLLPLSLKLWKFKNSKVHLHPDNFGVASSSSSPSLRIEFIFTNSSLIGSALWFSIYPPTLLDKKKFDRFHKARSFGRESKSI